MLAPIQINAYNQQLARVNPFSEIYTLNSGNTFPWLGNSPTGEGVPYPTRSIQGEPLNILARFGNDRHSQVMSKINDGFSMSDTQHSKLMKKFMSFGARSRKRLKKGQKKHVAWCIRTKRPVKVYKIYGKTGRYFPDNRKVPKSKKCYKTKSKAQKSLKTTSRKRKRTSKSREGPWASSKSWGKRYVVGKCVRRGRLVNVYEYDLRDGLYYSDRRKVPISADCDLVSRRRSRTPLFINNVRIRRDPTFRKHRVGYRAATTGRKLADAMSNRGVPCEKYTSEGTCKAHNARCKWDSNSESCSGKYGNAFGRINPANKFNYQLYQYGNNAGTPTEEQLRRIARDASYEYPALRNHTAYYPRNNYSGMGF